MLRRMKSRLVGGAFGALALIGVAACGSDAGTAGPGTTVKIGAASFVTLAPVLTSTTIAQGDTGAGGVVAGEQQYTVAHGDYPLKVAKLFCIKLDDLLGFNSWTSANQFPFPGTVIKIPPGACAPGSAQPQATTAAPPADSTPQATTTTFDASQGGTYTVVAGDTLSRIATKNGTTIDAIVAANGWEGPEHLIYKGLKIKLPAKTG